VLFPQVQLLRAVPYGRSNVDMYNIDSTRQMTTLFTLSASIVVAIHLLSCVTHLVAQHTDEVDTWIGVHGYLDHAPGMQYASCLYWTMNTMLGERCNPQDQASSQPLRVPFLDRLLSLSAGATNPVALPVCFSVCADAAR
jgi:hypothetical protein